MAQRYPETLAALRRSLDDGTAAILGGEWTETPLSLLGPEATASQSVRGSPRINERLGLPAGGVRAAPVRAFAPPCRKSSAGWDSPPPSTARSTTANFPPAARAESNGKASTAARSRRSAACRWTPAGRNRSSSWPKSSPRRASSTTRPRWCLPIGRAKPAVGMTICGASPPIAPSWGSS